MAVTGRGNLGDFWNVFTRCGRFGLGRFFGLWGLFGLGRFFEVWVYFGICTASNAKRDACEQKERKGTLGPWVQEGFNHATIPQNVDRKSTRLNSSHVAISYAVFCLKK